MEHTDTLDEILTCRLDTHRRVVEPCTIVIFGASGDLTARKLIPALYHLFVEKQLPNPFRIIGFARREKTDEQFREEMRAGIEQYSRTKKVDPAAWQAFSAGLFYCMGEFSDSKAYLKLGDALAKHAHEGVRKNALFYLSTSPSQFGEIVEHLATAKLVTKGMEGKFWQRIVVEKPFGHDLNSARQLNSELT